MRTIAKLPDDFNPYNPRQRLRIKVMDSSGKELPCATFIEGVEFCDQYGNVKRPSLQSDEIHPLLVTLGKRCITCDGKKLYTVNQCRQCIKRERL